MASTIGEPTVLVCAYAHVLCTRSHRVNLYGNRAQSRITSYRILSNCGLRRVNRNYPSAWSRARARAHSAARVALLPPFVCNLMLFNKQRFSRSLARSFYSHLSLVVARHSSSRLRIARDYPLPRFRGEIITAEERERKGEVKIATTSAQRAICLSAKLQGALEVAPMTDFVGYNV